MAVRETRAALEMLALGILAEEERYIGVTSHEALTTTGKANANAELCWPHVLDLARDITDKGIMDALGRPRIGAAIIERILVSGGRIVMLREEATKNQPVFSEKARLWHSSFIGKTGSGKTYAARGEVEDLLDAKAQVVIIDPTGAWPGLRCKSDGTPSGYPVAIFGGAHGDRPLTPDMAPALGRIAGTTDQSMILDLSGISLELEDQREIVHQFLRNLYRTNRKPLHLVIDEADEFAPQELDKETKPLRTLVARIMARGRSLGFRCTLITQRPAKIDKNSISQVESMAVLRVTAPQDRNAIVDWFADKGGADRKEILSGLGSLETGEGWVFTGLDGTYSHRRFRRIRTYDTSSTPIDAEGHARDIDTGDIDLSEIDEMVAYPEEETEEELEKAVARRRNLEEENKRLRARLLKSEARYEAMRRVFVQFRGAVDQALVDDGFEAVEYADLVILRDEVDYDNRHTVDLNDVTGVPQLLEGDWQANESEPPSSASTTESAVPTIPGRVMTPLEKTIFDEVRQRPSDVAALLKRTQAREGTLRNSIERLIEENTLCSEDGVLSPTTMAYLRQISAISADSLRRLAADPHDDLAGKRRTSLDMLRRLHLLGTGNVVTQTGRDVLALAETAVSEWTGRTLFEPSPYGNGN